MNTLIGSISHGMRKSRAPLSAGTLVIVAVWIQLADRISNEWPAPSFRSQLTDLLSSLEGVGIATLLLLVVGITGTVSIRASNLLFEPGMRWSVERWQERRAVRKHMRSNRWSPFDVSGPIEDIVDELVMHRRRYLKNGCRWIWDWIPDKHAYAEYHRENFWDAPKWDRQVVGWVSTEIHGALGAHRTGESLAQMKRRLAEDSELQKLVLALERDLESNPSGPFMGDEWATLAEHLDSAGSENDYRVAVVPALVLLFASVSLEWTMWALLTVPLLTLVYGSSLAKRDDIALLALGWLLDGKGTAHSLEEIRLWAREEARRVAK